MLNSVNCSTVFCSPTVILMLSREATSETDVPRVFFLIYLPLRSTFFLHLFSDLLNQKYKKYLATFYFYLFCFAFDLSIYYNFISRSFAYLEAPYLEGIDNPFNTSGCEDLLSVCRGCLRCDEDINTIVTPTVPATIHIGAITRARARQLN